MLTIKIEHFLKYCKVSNFADKSIESLRLRFKGFNMFVMVKRLAVFFEYKSGNYILLRL